MADIVRLRQAVSNFKIYTHPASSNGSDPCTVQDMNNLVRNLSEVLNVFIEELESVEE